MFDAPAQALLQEKLEYELWLLDFISGTLEVLEGGSVSRITLTAKKTEALVEVKVTDSLAAGAVIKIVNAIMPLTFTAAYKILDVIFEWILQENHDTRNGVRVPWKFSEKIKVIANSWAELNFPPLFQSNPYINQYLFALYSNLLQVRNEIVHNHRFSVSDNKLIIDVTENDNSFTLELDRGELSSFVKTVVAVANLLAGYSQLDKREDRLLKYYFDRIEKLHSLPKFDQKEPILMDVVYRVPVENELFNVDLKYIRTRVSEIHPNTDVLFNLEVVGLINNGPSIRWSFPVNSVTREDMLQLRLDDFKEYRVFSKNHNC
jgi:hypothetical protein